MSEISKEAAMVRDALLAQGLETPRIPVDMSHDEQRAEIEKHMGAIMDILGLDRSDDSLNRTPYRIAKMYVNEIFSGLDYANFPSITVIDNKMKVDEMVKVSDITLTSTCEHHFVTIDGKAKVAYLPSRKIIGLSKINRIVQFFARRPQVQEPSRFWWLCRHCLRPRMLPLPLRLLTTVSSPAVFRMPQVKPQLRLLEVTSSLTRPPVTNSSPTDYQEGKRSEMG